MALESSIIFINSDSPLPQEFYFFNIHLPANEPARIVDFSNQMNHLLSEIASK
jgi:hypothetical protein